MERVTVALYGLLLSFSRTVKYGSKKILRENHIILNDDEYVLIMPNARQTAFDLFLVNHSSSILFCLKSHVVYYSLLDFYDLIG